MFIVEPSPSRYREVDYRDSDYRDVEYRDVEYQEVERPVRHIARPRSVSIHNHRPSSPVRFIESRPHVESRHRDGAMVLVRPKHSDRDLSVDIRDLEEERQLLRAERQGGIEITRQRDTDILDDRGNEEEITEVRRQERSGKLISLTS